MSRSTSFTSRFRLRMKVWRLRVGIPVLLLGTAAVAIAAGPLHVWAPGDTLQATDLNGNMSNLSTQIATVQGLVHAASGFRATLSSPVSIPNASFTTVAFGAVEFDLGAEYQPVTGAFTPKQAGVYMIFCACEYSPTVAGSLYQASIFKNGARFGLTEVSASTTNGITPEHTMVAQLAANDVITCATGQFTGATASLYGTAGLTQFGAARLY